MIHTDEPRLGKDRALHQIEAEAVDFIGQMRRDDIFQNETEYQSRLKEALKEINQNAKITRLTSKDTILKPCNGKISSDVTSHGWTHTHRELEYGIRMAWKHSRKCIMRSQYKDLRLCDLRHVNKSAAMGTKLIEALKEAFNGGDILPTVFVFPPKQAGKSGPMLWNQQLLAFAGYTNDDGSILGDPINAEITASIIELGWKPPEFRTKWDLLPLVTMAEGDEPAITEISKEDFPLVHVRHPQYELPFEKLGLRWVPAPALSRLGFDIGGVQYTATPFIGWFMDAEIGVRDLADQFRYDVLPKVVRALYPGEIQRPIEQLPEYERLALLSRAQAELNFAVYHSFLQNRVRMSDTLTASSNYCQFDDEHFKQRGFRLPADPYWLAPPQGSIVPIWHRGGAPHYQPKPMICRHREDPVKAWKRRQKVHKGKPQKFDDTDREKGLTANGSCFEKERSRFMIHYCSTGTIAAKLADAVHDILQSHCSRMGYDSKILRPRSLDDLVLSDLSPDDVLIVIASSTGRGDIPPNGQQLQKRLEGTQLPATRFVVFGNGDSSYGESFNGAAHTLFNRLKDAGLYPLGDGYVEGDNAKESPPWKLLDAWLKQFLQQVFHEDVKTNGFHHGGGYQTGRTERWQQTMDSYARFQLSASPNNRQNVKKVRLRSNDETYAPMDNLLVLAPNDNRIVRRALQLLRSKSHRKVARLGQISIYDFLREFVALEGPFGDMSWIESLDKQGLDTSSWNALPVIDVLRSLPAGWQSRVDLEDVLLSMPMTTPRTFSIASAPGDGNASKQQCSLELLVQTKRDGKFSGQYLNAAKSGDSLRCKIQSANAMQRLLDKNVGHIIAFVTGSGFAPMQSLLQFRTHQSHVVGEEGATGALENGISLFVGFNAADTQLIRDGVSDAITMGLLDMLILMPSNARKARVQDKVFQPGIREHMEGKIRNGAHVFVCANPAAADDIAANLSAVLGCDVRTTLGEKYVQASFGTAH
ncbi:MAG: hypothetical protein M1822_004064 [Bathelium mastoideum]|nr:MAG: hypothetical protein M1822_004064 [Bathelium mastoideum]